MNSEVLRVDEEKSAVHFDRVAAAYAGYYEDRSPTGHSFRARRSKAHSLLGSGPLGDLLDIGGASGVYLDVLKSQVRSYHIVDISPEMIELARQIPAGDTEVHCQVASAYALPYPDMQFDTILAMGVLEYMDDPWQSLAEMARVARPDGRILISFPNAHSPMRKLSKFIYRCVGKPSPFASKMFSITEVQSAAAALPLERTCISGYNAQLVPFPFSWRLRSLAYCLAVLLEPLLNRMGRLWGTGFTVEFKKRG